MISSSRKRLYCHYCNRKSGLIYDGSITQWKCTNCEAVNNLDENGDITDPEILSDNPASAPRYATVTPSEYTPSLTDSNIFCALCLKNQHLYTSSLAQFYTDIDLDDSTVSNKHVDYDRFRMELEKRYPQVCESCEPTVKMRMKEAGKIAKADHLRRLMDKSRANRMNSTKYSLLTIDAVGKTLWNIGLYGQIIRSLMTITSATLHSFGGLADDSIYGLAHNVIDLINSITSSQSWSYRTLLCTIFSVWWCPNSEMSSSGHTSELFDSFNRYHLQLTFVFIRMISYHLMRNDFFPSNPFSLPIIGANILLSVLTILIAVRAASPLKSKTTLLWNLDPEKLTFRPQNCPSRENSESMGDILNDISLGRTSPSISSNDYDSNMNIASADKSAVISQNFKKKSSILSSQAPVERIQTQPAGLWPVSKPTYQQTNSNPIGRLNDQNRLSSFPTIGKEMPARLTPSLLKMSEQEATSYLQEGKLPENSAYEEMDWQSTQSYRAFNPRPKVQTEPVNHTPVLSSSPSPFWFKVPAAPTTPARRIRNPPIKPNMDASQTTPRLNFFQNSSQLKSTNSKLIDQTRALDKNSTTHKLELSQRKFFPPETTSEAEVMLTDLLEDFSLSSADTRKKHLPSNIDYKYAIPRFLFAAIIPTIGFALYMYFHFL